MQFEHSEKAAALQSRLRSFMEEHVHPNEAAYEAQLAHAADRWQPLPLIEALKRKAREAGLWNLFLPHSPRGAGLTNLEYAPLSEIMGRVSWASEVFNCSAPDTGNMETFEKYGTEAQKTRWLRPLLDGDIRSAFCMTEPAVASSDATNIETRIERSGDDYVINGRKWWSSGAGDSRCAVFIVMGKSDPANADKHRQQSMILVPRDTQPDSLVDWQTNTRNGIGKDTDQYAAMRQLTSKMSLGEQRFDIAGYSKGGGIAQEGGLLNPDSQVRVFNSAGLPDAALKWTGQQNFDGLVSRTQSFSAEGDFLTFMNTTTDPGQNIINARFLRRELAGEGKGVNPINIKVRDPAMRGVDDPAFASDKANYLSELDAQIDSMQSAFDTGGTVSGFPPVRAAASETINDSMTTAGKLFGARSDQPTLGKLAQHKMSAVLDSMESNVKSDRNSLQKFMRDCG